MSRHATAEMLSAYLDDELEEAVELRLVEHLEDCADCRVHLDGLRRVVTGLERLERVAPPPVLAGQVTRQVKLTGRPRSHLEAFEERLAGLRQPSSLLFTFALVFALAVILYFFAHGVERAGRPRTALVLGGDSSVAVRTGEVIDTRQAAGRTFDLVDGVWHQRRLAERVPEQEWPVPVEAASREGRGLLALYPDLGELGDRIVLELGGVVVELRGAARWSDYQRRRGAAGAAGDAEVEPEPPPSGER